MIGGQLKLDELLNEWMNKARTALTACFGKRSERRLCVTLLLFGASYPLASVN